MKKLIVSMNITLDGFMSGLHHDLNWHIDNWSSDMGERLGIELNNADTILLGRITYEALAAYWPAKAIDLGIPREEVALANMMNAIKKVVYSKTLQQPVWQNSTVINGNIKTEITNLKQQPGRKSIMVYGSSQLVTALIKQELVDEYQLWVHPVILGKGNHLFTRLKQSAGLRLMGTTTFQSGVVLMNYQLI